MFIFTTYHITSSTSIDLKFVSVQWVQPWQSIHFIQKILIALTLSLDIIPGNSLYMISLLSY